MTSYSPQTEADTQEMLKAIGVSSMDELFSIIPEALRFTSELPIPKGKSEYDTLDYLDAMSKKNTTGRDLVCFAGGGAYDHDIPSAVKRLMFRTEFVTAYTPYQPEVSQGVLQALFEFQTFVTRLFGLPVANASLYDGATALVEAINIVNAETGKDSIAISDGVNPNWVETARTYAAGTGHQLQTMALENGLTKYENRPECGAIIVQYPNYLGNIEDLQAARACADASGALLIVVADVVALGLLKSPGEFGADIVIAEGQPFGTPLSFGGPYVGLIAVKENLTRRLPGRLVGETADADGRRAFVTTLRTREQDIRREKASSNICTNQTLIAVGFAIHASMLGTSGLHELATRCLEGTHYLVERLEERTAITRLYNSPFLRECAVKTPIPAGEMIDRLVDEGYLAGLPVRGDDHALLVTATEKRTKDEIDDFVDAIAKAVER